MLCFVFFVLLSPASTLFLRDGAHTDKNYRILNYTRIKPRSKPPHKKSAYFTHPDFSATKLENSAQFTRVNTVFTKLRPAQRHYVTIQYTSS
jgi:hypothetical protein